jgi:hypothetical protein
MSAAYSYSGDSSTARVALTAITNTFQSKLLNEFNKLRLVVISVVKHVVAVLLLVLVPAVGDV